MADDDLVVRARLRDELSRPLENVQREVRQTDRAVEGLDRSSHRAATGGIARLDRAVRAIDGPTGRLTRSLASLAKAAAVAGAAGAVAITAFGVRSASQIEQTRIAFDGLLGSATAGKKLFESLQALNLRTPFEFGDVSSGARQLLGFGFDLGQIIPIMEAATNAAAGLGQGGEGLNRILLNLGQIRARGAVMGQELRDFATMGFPAYEIVADILGVTREQVQALGDDARVSSDKFIAAVIAQQGPLARFGGMAEAQMNSLAGQWSNLKDTFSFGLAEAASPLVDSIKGVMPELQTTLGQVLQTAGPAFFGFLGSALEALVDVLPELGGSLVELFDSLGPVMPDVVDAIVGLVGLLPSFARLLGNVAPVLNDLLEFEPLVDILDELLLVMLGFKAVRTVTSAIDSFSRSMRNLTTSTTTGTPPASRPTSGGGGGPTVVTGGRGGGWGGPAGLIAGLGLSILGSNMGGEGGQALSAVGTGVSMGSMFGPLGALAGGAGGLFIDQLSGVWAGYKDVGPEEFWKRTGAVLDDPLSLFTGPSDEERARRTREFAVPRARERSARNAIEKGIWYENGVNVARQPDAAAGGAGGVVINGGITVNNPTTEIDIVRAIQKYERDRHERGG